ncbi:MAG: type II toxin-antitoxin system RelE/ParE family toxin [Myxococcota bacterium]
MVITAQAGAQITAAKAWWRSHRLAARDLFEAEVDAVVDRLETEPNIGAVVSAGRRPVRCMVMQRTGFRAFYRVDEKARLIRLLSVWSARRGQQPRF